MNGIKPRYDGQGSEFGNMHRVLPKYCGMFDIDKMTASAIVSLELKHQDVGFIEYRTNWSDSSVKWIALFEIKFKYSTSVYEALEFKKGTATWAQLKLCQTLNMRYIFVIATEGKQPFDFYEVHYDGSKKLIGTLKYNQSNKKQKVKEFWKHINLL